MSEKELLGKLAEAHERSQFAELRTADAIRFNLQGKYQNAAHSFREAGKHRNQERSKLQDCADLCDDWETVEPPPIYANVWKFEKDVAFLCQGPSDWYFLPGLDTAPAGEVKRFEFHAKLRDVPSDPHIKNKLFYICDRKSNGDTAHKDMLVYAFYSSGVLTFRSGWDCENADKTKPSLSVAWSGEDNFQYSASYPGSEAAQWNSQSKVGGEPTKILVPTIGEHGLYATFGGEPGDSTETSPVGVTLERFWGEVEYVS